MNNELNQIFMQVLIAVISIVSVFILRLINIKAEQIKLITNNKKIDKLIDLAKEAVTKSVIAVNQSYVDKLKEQNIFTEEKQKEAFREAKRKVLSILTDDTKRAILLLYADLDGFIDAQIEATVNNVKKTNILHKEGIA